MGIEEQSRFLLRCDVCKRATPPFEAERLAIEAGEFDGWYVDASHVKCPRHALVIMDPEIAHANAVASVWRPLGPDALATYIDGEQWRVERFSDSWSLVSPYGTEAYDTPEECMGAAFFYWNDQEWAPVPRNWTSFPQGWTP